MNIRYYRPETKSSKNTAIAEIFNFVTFAAVTFPISLRKVVKEERVFPQKHIILFLIILFNYLILFNIYIYKGRSAKMQIKTLFEKNKKCKNSPFLKINSEKKKEYLWEK